MSAVIGLAGNCRIARLLSGRMGAYLSMFGSAGGVIQNQSRASGWHMKPVEPGCAAAPPAGRRPRVTSRPQSKISAV